MYFAASPSFNLFRFSVSLAIYIPRIFDTENQCIENTFICFGKKKKLFIATFSYTYYYKKVKMFLFSYS